MKKSMSIGLFLLLLSLVPIHHALGQTPASEWQKSKHANKELAVHEATWEGRKDLAAHCARCHSEQGFKAWLPQLLKGDAGLLKKPDGSKADEAFIKGIGLTKDKVEPTTCATCHSSGSALLVDDNIPVLSNGVAIRSVGKGAICMACHNTRNGRIAWDSMDPKLKYTQPHEAAQADVIMGKNVFFYNDTGDTVSPHAAFTGDSCVSCHKQLSKGGHSFKAGECGGCHGEKMTEGFVAKGTVGLLKQLSEQIEKRVLASKEKIACVTSWNPDDDKDTPNVSLDGSRIKAVEIPTGIHGQISLKFVLQNGKAVYSQMGNIKEACGDQAKPVFATSDPVVRALWNYLLFEYDGSKGVHNPSFTRNVLISTINAMSK